ncbi:MAG: helix-hairpin-helix domain-containing protein [Candidatus Riflebacteria bacterium]|nr:helix-hairpin-helix domain-containing protein [Candidatus Riflebacteria bacterium]
MKLNRTEKITFSVLTFMLVFGFMLLIVRLSNANSNASGIIFNINNIAQFTDRTPLEKTIYFDEVESQNKLNLNRTNLVSIKKIPCLSAPMAKRIFEFITEKGQIKDLTDLLEVKGMSRKRLRELDKYATVMGGHAGSAAWGSKVDLNFASEAELTNLPGISKKMAEKIINFRNSNGGFRSIDELYEIPGLTEKTIKRFIDSVEVK